jgi:carbon-monoxide dehydrogenase large subunit
VLAVLIGQDMMDDGLKNIPHTPFGLGTADISIENKDGTPIRISPHYSIALERVRYVGEVVAVVVANSVEIAKDGAELVEVEYDILQLIIFYYKLPKLYIDSLNSPPVRVFLFPTRTIKDLVGSR